MTDEELVELYQSGMPVAKIASTAGIPAGSLYRLMRRSGFEGRRLSAATVSDLDRQITAAYLTGDTTTDEVAEQFGIAPGRIYESLRRVGLQPNRHNRQRRRGTS